MGLRSRGHGDVRPRGNGLEVTRAKEGASEGIFGVGVARARGN